MSDLVIRVEALSKQYMIALRQYRHDTLRDQLTDGLKALFRRNGRVRLHRETMWALKDVSFEVREGEVVGIIGHNGAGKSTLLKVLSRITEPTSGWAKIRGRVGSLLEVGTGFHPELTGRENTYLNGAILGMKRAEIERKFDEIVAFAEVERFIDTPVKHYSTGMYLRLAFAVAAHLEPEILVVDEVLAVGDAAFQKKSLGKMGDVAKEGRTVLFVSHNMGAIKSLCSRAIFLKAGNVACDGSVDHVVDTYLMTGTEMSTTGLVADDTPRIGTGKAKIRSVQLAHVSPRQVSQLYFREPLRMTVSLDVITDIQDAFIEVNISTLDGIYVVFSTSMDGGKPPVHLTRGRYEVDADFDVVLLPGRYSIGLGIHHIDGTTIDFVQRVLDFAVLKVDQNGGDHYRWDSVRGYVSGLSQWHVRNAAQ
jgi:lipopolysaccharide transport system ATP-binding protein